MKPGQMKTKAELCFQTKSLCNSLLRAKDTLEDPQVNDLSFNPGLAWKQPRPQPYRKSLGDSEKKVADKQPSSIESLKEAIKEVWIKEISAEYCNHLILSMPRRIQAVIKSKGGHTKY